MLPTTRDRTDDLHALEELWAAPAFGEPEAHRRRLPLVPGALVAGGWLTFYVVAIAFQPAPEPGMTWPVWATAVSLVQILLLLGAAAIGPLFAKVGFAGAASPGRWGSCSRSTAARPSITWGTGGWPSWEWRSPSRASPRSGSPSVSEPEAE